MLDPEEPGVEVLIERAQAAEEAALAVAGVTNSEGAEAGWGRSSVALAASNGFAGAYSGSSQGISASVIAGSGTGMERDYDFASAIFAADLRDPAEVGKSAGERAVKRLRAKKMPTCRCPVVFDPRVARGFISHLLGAISGPSIARGTSFLKDRLGDRIFPEAITIIDDPHRHREGGFFGGAGALDQHLGGGLLGVEHLEARPRLRDLGRIAQIGGKDGTGKIVIALHASSRAADHARADAVA